MKSLAIAYRLTFKSEIRVMASFEKEALSSKMTRPKADFAVETKCLTIDYKQKGPR